MAPIYSKTGCTICKRRRKKCDEGKPSCDACRRLALPCHYGRDNAVYSSQPGPFQIGVFELQHPQLQTRLLPVGLFRPGEPSIIARVPSSVVRFFSPTADAAGREPKVLMQMVLTESTVRAAVVSCFSTILPAHNSETGHLDRASFGTALELVRSQLGDPKTDFEKLSILQVAIQFLGLIESLGPQQSPDPATHWIALARLIGWLRRTYPERRSPLTPGLHILTLEAVLYHFALFVPFTKDIEVLDKAWRQNDIVFLLDGFNPEGPERLSYSPLVAGQYELWCLAYEALYLSRSPVTVKPGAQVLSQKKRTIQQIQSNLDLYLATSPKATPSEQRAVSEMYQVHCIALLVCFTALEPATTERSREIRKLITDAVQRFVEWDLIQITYSAAMWSMHILACGISEKNDWDKFNTKLSCLKRQLDAGNLRRLESVLAQVKLVRAIRCIEWEDDSVAAVDQELELPGSLFLLHQPEGMLHDWRI